MAFIHTHTYIYTLTYTYSYIKYTVAEYIPLLYFVTNMGTVFVETVGAKVVTVVVCGMSKNGYKTEKENEKEITTQRKREIQIKYNTNVRVLNVFYRKV